MAVLVEQTVHCGLACPVVNALAGPGQSAGSVESS